MVAKRVPQEPPPTAAESVSYIYFLLQELEPMARTAGEVKLLTKLVEARDEAAKALQRARRHSGGD